MKLKQFLNFPAAFKERNEDVKLIIPKLFNIEVFDNNPLISYKCNNKYLIKILLIGKEVDEDNEVKLSCTCPSFNFEFANGLYNRQALFQPENFVKSIKSPPKQRNQFNIVTGCKHCIACMKHVFKHMDAIQLNLNKKIKKGSN